MSKYKIKLSTVLLKVVNLSIINKNVIILGRVIALDLGKKRTGIAVTDEMQIIASGLKTVETKQLFSFLMQYFKEENVELIIIGEPKQMDNSVSESEAMMLPIIKKLGQTFSKIPIKRIDERFTSKMAFQTMIDSGLGKKKRQNKALIDEISATIILQSYLHTN